MGLIEKTHTSSGRVPSAKGYRYYAEHLRDKTVDEEIKYTQVGTLSDGVKVSESNLIGMDVYEKKGRMTTQISASSSDNQYPSAKAVYDLLQNAMGSYVTDIAVLVGGDA